MRTLLPVLALLLAGCTAPPPAGDGPPSPPPSPAPEDGLPKVEVLLGPGPWRLDEPVEFTLSFRNTSNRTFEVESPCKGLRFDVTVGPEYDPEPERPATRTPTACLQAITSHQIVPGEGFTRNFSWTPSSLRHDPGEVLLRATVDAVEDASWSTFTQRNISLIASVLPRIQVEPERPFLRAGEVLNITATFHNNSTRNFTYTSRDGCNDIDVWIPHGDGYGDHIALAPANGTTCPTAETPFTIPPGAHVTATVSWDGKQHGRPLPPGRYVVLAEFDGPPGPLDPPWASWGHLELELRA